MWKKCRLVFQTVIIFVESTTHRSSGSWQSACNELHKALTVWIHHLLPTKQATIQYRLYESLWDSHQGSSQENKWHLNPAVKKKNRKKNKKRKKFFHRLGIHKRTIMGQPGYPHIVPWDVWQESKQISFQLVTQSFIGEDCVTSQRSICLGDFRVKQHPLASLWQCGYPLYHYSLTGWITLCHCRGK